MPGSLFMQRTLPYFLGKSGDTCANRAAFNKLYSTTTSDQAALPIKDYLQILFK